MKRPLWIVNFTPLLKTVTAVWEPTGTPSKTHPCAGENVTSWVSDVTVPAAISSCEIASSTAGITTAHSNATPITTINAGT